MKNHMKNSNGKNGKGGESNATSSPDYAGSCVPGPWINVQWTDVFYGNSTAIWVAVMPEDLPPVNRSQCIGGPRPCPWIRCRHHMIWSIPAQRLVKMTDAEIVDAICSDLPETCVLDVIDNYQHEPMSLRQIARVMLISPECVRKIESKRRHLRLSGVSKIREVRSRAAGLVWAWAY